jgi:DNA-binding Xre family transcriptional regulator
MNKISYKKVSALISEGRMSQSELYKYLEISRQLWNGFKKTDIPLKYLDGIAKFFNVLPNVLVTTDIGDSYINNNEVLTIKSYDNKIAGLEIGSELTSLEDIKFGTLDVDSMVLPKNINKEKVRAVVVDGKSMLPTLMPNDWVIFEETDGNFIGDDLYVVNYLNNLLVKRICFNPEKSKLDIISDNNAYPTYSIEFNKNEDKTFAIIGKVVATMQQ